MVRFIRSIERRVQGRRVLRVVEHFFEPPRRSSHQLSSFDLHDTIVFSRLEHMAVQSRWTKDATDDLLVEIESVGDDQGKTLVIHPVRDIAQQSERVSVASSSSHCRRPETRPDFDRDEYPRQPCLAASEGANLVGEPTGRSPISMETPSWLCCRIPVVGSSCRRAITSVACSTIPGSPMSPTYRYR